MKYQTMFSIDFLLTSPTFNYCPLYPGYSLNKSVTISRFQMIKQTKFPTILSELKVALLLF